MAQFQRRLRRIEQPRMAAIGLGAAFLLVLAAYAYALTNSTATLGGIVSAVALVGIAGTGLLYAWRAVTGISNE